MKSMSQCIKTPEKKGLKKSDPDSTKKRKKGSNVIPQLVRCVTPLGGIFTANGSYILAGLVSTKCRRQECLLDFFNAFEIPLDFPIHSLTHHSLTHSHSRTHSHIHFFPHSHSSLFSSRTAVSTQFSLTLQCIAPV
jgi:hypothetical protein